ncbi:MAG: hypothetical protein IKH77_01120 [Clostridia bacterium]|nr:hypothetical protein [Clostridia bacterium]
MKIALVGQEIPTLLPSLLADLLFAQKTDAVVSFAEKNDAMRDLMQRYAEAVCSKAGRGRVEACRERREALDQADAVIYAGEMMASSRFHMDQEALSGVEEGDEGLSDQARTLGGIGGLMRTLRQGEQVFSLCDEMKACCPAALVITLGQPVARTVAMFRQRGFRCWGLTNGWRKGPGGLEWLCRKLRIAPEKAAFRAAGLPSFCFLTEMRDARSGKDLLPAVRAMAEDGALGRMAQRWNRTLDAVPVGSIPAHAELMASQEDFRPDEEPALTESVERRKERILRMNTVAERGLEDREAQASQLLLLARAPAARPVALAVALLEGKDLKMEAVVRVNEGRTIVNLPSAAVIEAPLSLSGGEDRTAEITLPAPLAELCMDIDEAGRLAAKAAEGDRSALRESIETDPALGGLDRLYVLEVVDRMIAMHADILTRWEDRESGEDED